MINTNDFLNKVLMDTEALLPNRKFSNPNDYLQSKVKEVVKRIGVQNDRSTYYGRCLSTGCVGLTGYDDPTRSEAEEEIFDTDKSLQVLRLYKEELEHGLSAAGDSFGEKSQGIEGRAASIKDGSIRVDNAVERIEIIHKIALECMR